MLREMNLPVSAIIPTIWEAEIGRIIVHDTHLQNNQKKGNWMYGSSNSACFVSLKP
jgi:hypothetical protein